MTKEIPILDSCDVLVCGGGFGGISAALPVLLLEGYGGQRPTDDRGSAVSLPGEISGKSKEGRQPECRRTKIGGV